MTTTAKILAKGTKGTGLDEVTAKKFYDQLGLTKLAIVELVSDKRGDDREGSEHVDLQILTLEIVDDKAVDHVRGLQRAHFMNRKLHSEDYQPTLDSADDVEPNVSDVMAKGLQFTPHDYFREIDGTNCNICGNPEDAPLHAGGPDDEDTEDEADDADDDADDEPTPGDPSYEPHEFVGEFKLIGGFPANCDMCDQPAGAAVHAAADDLEEAPA
jgi:hypothetical protein